MDKAIGHISLRIMSIVATISCSPLLVASLSCSVIAMEPEHLNARAVPHPPRNVTERRLDEILRAGDQDPALIDLMTGQRVAGPKAASHLRSYFTRSLLKSIGDFERKLVNENCGGTYRQDDICGMNSSPLNCAQESPPYGYNFLTENSGSKQETIAVSWLLNGPIVSRYRLVKDGNSWKIDGILCVSGNAFNW